MLRCFERAAADTRDFFGWDLKTILTAVVLVGLGFVLLWRVRGSTETKEEVVKWIILTLFPFVIFVAGLMLFNLARSPYFIVVDEHARAEAAIADASKKTDAAEREKRDAEEKATDLQKKLQEKPNVVYQTREVKVPVPATSEHSEDERQRRKAIRVELGKFSEEGEQVLATITRPDLADADADKIANGWNSKVEAYIRSSLGDDYIARYRSGAGLPPIGPSATVSAPRGNLWSGVYNRLSRLQEFLRELRD